MNQPFEVESSEGIKLIVELYDSWCHQTRTKTWMYRVEGRAPLRGIWGDEDGQNPTFEHLKARALEDARQCSVGEICELAWEVADHDAN